MVVIAIRKQPDKLVCTQARLVGMLAAANGSRTHGQPAGPDPGIAKDHFIMRVVFACQRLSLRQRHLVQGGCSKTGDAKRGGSVA
jgi:hypothetical protein